MPARHEIVVGLTDTTSSRAALRWAERQARITGSSVRAVHVLDWPIGMAAFGPPTGHQDGVLTESDVDPAYRHGIRAVFDEFDHDRSWSLEFAGGEAGPELVRSAREAELLVIGSRGGAESPSQMSGYVARYCLSYGSGALVVITDDTDRTLQTVLTARSERGGGRSRVG